jgi:CrcB protein
MLKVVLMMGAGSVGTLCRYLLQGAVQGLFSASFPFGTLVVNLTGCFIFGFIWSLAEERFAISPEARLVLLVGLLGAFTTFSTFAFESLEELREGELLLMAVNIGAQVVLGIALTWAGIVFARTLGGVS